MSWAQGWALGIVILLGVAVALLMGTGGGDPRQGGPQGGGFNGG